MSECKNCKFYDCSDSYPGTGYCDIESDYVKENDICNDYEEND